MIDQAQKRRVNDYIIDHFEGGWYHPGMRSEIKRRTGFDMLRSGYTMFGFDYPASQDKATFDAMLTIAQKYGYNLLACDDIKYHNDRADGTRYFPRAMGDELRVLMCNRAWRVAEAQLTILNSGAVFEDDVLTVLVYATYAQNMLPEHYSTALTQVNTHDGTRLTLDIIGPLIISALVAFPGPWYQDHVIEHFGLLRYGSFISADSVKRLRHYYDRYLTKSTKHLKTVERILADRGVTAVYQPIPVQKNHMSMSAADYQPVARGKRYLIRG